MLKESTLVSCIMPTANRPQFVPRAIEHFLAQDHAEKELIILDDGEQSVEALIPAHPQIRYIRQTSRRCVGTKRNLACQEAQGEVIVHWDDDDWSAPWRLSYQLQALVDSGDDMCGLDRVWFLDPATPRAWEYVYGSRGPAWVYGASLCYRKAFWRQHPFADVSVGEDSRFVWGARGARIRALPDNGFLVALVHDANTSPKQVQDSRWQPRPVAAVHAVMDSGRRGVPAQARTAEGAPLVTVDAAPGGPSALVSAALGVGDILRVTPLIRVLHQKGFQVDVLVAPDYPETLDLLRGAPEIRRLIHYPAFRSNRGMQAVPELAGDPYALAVHTTWSAPLARWVKARETHAFERGDWLARGDVASVERIARQLGWEGPLPEPFAMTSGRRFELAPGTIALHPGCKPDWPWKRWHGFAELAARLPQVVIVGSDSDRDHQGTYFNHPHQWPAHAKDLTGKLSLADTAALISQCAGLVANDSGLLHLGVALGVPSFGIFGITSPAREAIPSRFMHAITKGLSCEAACRAGSWGRRDCERHLECLKSLTAEEVMGQIALQLPVLHPLPAITPVPERSSAVNSISLNYFGYVFDQTGYGEAARAYVHALHAAGVRVSVINIGGGSPGSVDDDLLLSLMGCHADADFNLFHGIPPQWAQRAFAARNVIAMTVWETDAMPQRWRNPLAHALDVWLPCQFNVDVFSRDLRRPVFRLPHPVPPKAGDVPRDACEVSLPPGVQAADFVFYSIFEWQDRKNPRGMIEAFLRAFPQEADVVLLLKSNPGANAEAHKALDEARAVTGSLGRVVLCCEAWTPAQLQALHERGDCYFSLHKGEGWGYPLFNAACRGKPVIATAYSGPLDYLDTAAHRLVRQSLSPVRQVYQYYERGMHWAEPDLADATASLREVHLSRDQRRQNAQRSAEALQFRYSLEEVGALARMRLMSLLRRTDCARWEGLRHLERGRSLAPSIPIPGEWYDAGYFELGTKSNWEQGYSWDLFKGVFEETAAYLHTMFPEANTFLDVGCAKGFLVRALRALRLEAWGFDHSPWAIAHADADTRPFLQLAGIETMDCARSYDLVTAFSVLQSLSEPQIDLLLSRLRPCTRQALICFIPTVAEGVALSPAAEDSDLSHVTLRPRSWWHQKFLAAGWRQDALHRIVEGHCRRHPLPVRMAWEIYVYAP